MRAEDPPGPARAATPGWTERNDILLVEMVPAEERIQEFIRKLSAIRGVEVKSMVFDHPAS